MNISRPPNSLHPNAKFEGYYSRFSLPSGAVLIIIICTVHVSKSRPHNVNITLIPSSSKQKTWQIDLWPENLNHRVSGDNADAWMMTSPDMTVGLSGTGDSMKYSICSPSQNIDIRATTTSRTAWSNTTDTPEGLLAYLPLPLHWHVQSLASPGTISLELPASAPLADGDRRGHTTVHQEKNWAHSFPSAHVWLSARNHETGHSICLAGGRTMGLDAFILGSRGPETSDLDLKPPFAMKLPFLPSPFLSFDIDWDKRTFTLDVCDFSRRVVIKASAPEDSFYTFAGPFEEGFKENWMAQTSRATIEVETLRREWFSGWVKEASHSFAGLGTCLEFGGDYYPLRGSGQKDK